MIKITGNSNGTNRVSGHLDYISRNGKVELINESGQEIIGKSEVNDAIKQMGAEQIPEDGKKTEYLHVMFSMPGGTPANEFKHAVSSFCQQEFSNRRYLMAFHDDTDHAHMHVCLGTRDIYRADEPRLSPRKADLRRWRTGFAESLREVGIEASASPKVARFNFKKHESLSKLKINERNNGQKLGDKHNYPKLETLRRSVNTWETAETAETADTMLQELQSLIDEGNRLSEYKEQQSQSSKSSSMCNGLHL